MQTFVEPTGREHGLILALCEDAYRDVKHNLCADWMEWSHFERSLMRLDRTSSPGYPYCLEATTIGDWLWGPDGLFYIPERAERLWHDMHAFLNGENPSLYRVFIKEEPHKSSKALVERWRLIICPPLYEQVAWSMTFMDTNDKEIVTCGLSPSYQGIKLSGGLWKDHVALFRQLGLVQAVDKSAWDWTAHKYWIDMDLELRRRLISSDIRVGRWYQIAEKLYSWAFDNPRLVLSDGRVFQQTHPGVMKSGCVNTISSNSHMQVFVHIYACLVSQLPVLPLPVAVGDDTLNALQNAPGPTAFEKAGCVSKEGISGFEFVGHRFSERGTVPLYNSKHIVRYAVVAKQHLPSFLESMVRLYAHSPAFQRFWRALARRHDVRLPSEEYVLYWYDHPAELLELFNNRY